MAGVSRRNDASMEPVFVLLASLGPHGPPPQQSHCSHVTHNNYHPLVPLVCCSSRFFVCLFFPSLHSSFFSCSLLGVQY